MKRLRKAAIVLGVSVFALGIGQACAVAQAVPGNSSPSANQNADLDKLIAQLNAASSKFKSAQADFSWDQYQAVVQEHDVQSGSIYFERREGTTQMAAYVKESGGQSAPKDLVYDGAQLQLYQPSIKQMTVFRANHSQAESYLTLGFGGSGDSLKANWDITLMGRETMNGVDVVKLDLKPKAQNVKNMFAHVTIWLDPARGISLKQIFYQPSGDQSTNTYTNIKYNQPISEDEFHLKVAPGTAVQNK